MLKLTILYFKIYRNLTIIFEEGIAIKKFFKSLDLSIIVIVLILFSIGAIALYSANGGFEGDTSETMKQIAWFLVGIVCMLLVSAIDYDFLAKIWIVFYVIMIILLVLVLFSEPINRSN